MAIRSDGLQRFSIRKASFGATSVLLGTLVFLAGSPVSADELSTAQSVSTGLVVGEAHFEESPDLKQTDDKTLAEVVNTLSLDTDVSREGLLAEKTISDETSGLEESSDLARSAEMTSFEVVDTVSLDNDVSREEVLVEDRVKVSEEKLSTVELSQGAEVLDLSPKELSLPTNELEVASPFRRANHGSVALGDNYPQVWKNGVIWQSVDNWNMYVKECVSFAAFRLSSVNGFELPHGYGNANTWGHIARRAGYRVDMTPALGAVAWMDANQYGAYGAGHVAWVSHVDGDRVEIEEYNYNNNHAYNRRVIHKNQVSGYIHFKDLTKPVSSSTTTKPADTKLAAKGTYHFTAYAGVKAEPKLSSPDLAYYNAGHTVNYDSVLEADGHQWISYLSYNGNRRYVAVAKAEAPLRQGTLSVYNHNHQAGTFEVKVSNVPDNPNIKAVKVGVWTTADGKDDMVWYTASQQKDGNYKVSVAIAQHDHERGEYNVLLQYVTNDRQKVTVTQTTTRVEVAPTTSPALPPRGTYHFTQRASIKAEPKVSSPELAYYDVGYSVNYDSIITAEGRQWLSYLSYAGNRRYVALP